MRNPPITDTPRIFYGNMDALLSSKGTLFPSAVAGFDPHSPTPATYNYSLGVQRDLGFGTVIDISYSGSQSRHLQQARNINQIPYGANFARASQDPTRFPAGVVPTCDTTISRRIKTRASASTAPRPCQQTSSRPYPGYGNITYYENGGLSNYNALQVAVNRRFTRPAIRRGLHLFEDDGLHGRRQGRPPDVPAVEHLGLWAGTVRPDM